MKVVLLAAALPLMPLPASASTITLFDGSLGTLPASQGWLSYFAVPSGSQTLVPGGVVLDTTLSAMGGYSSHTPFATPTNPAYPALSAVAGFQLDFTLRLLAEVHLSADRAGLSVIALDGAGFGIELGFWGDRIFAQEVGFTHAEQALFPTGVTPINYALQILGGGYQLTGNGNVLLAGQTRNYSGFGPPYSVPSFIFLGDDTSSASASVFIGGVTLTTPVPEPSTFALGVVGLMCLAAARRSRRIRT